jgi:SAM-dependent methyltransferase
MGRWSARLAPLFLDFCGGDAPHRLLDVGCGTGVLSEAIVQRWPGAEVLGIDPAADLLDFARRRLSGTAARFEVGDALDLPGPDATFDGAFALLILQEFPEPERLVHEMARVTATGGLVATCQWDFVGGMPMLAHFWDAVTAAHPGGETERETKRRVPKGRTTEVSLADLWCACGLQNVTTTTIEVAQPFAGLAELRRRLIGGDSDRPFALTARAFAVHGRVPHS